MIELDFSKLPMVAVARKKIVENVAKTRPEGFAGLVVAILRRPIKPQR